MDKKNNMSWSLTGIWNDKLIFGRNQRKLYKRDYIWASEVGKNYYERWLKMNAIEPDFDFKERVLRKFEAGNFFERIVGFVLVSAGVLIYDNKPYKIPADDDHLAVSVRPDFVAGGKPDWEKARKNIDEEMLFKIMPNLKRIAEALVEHFSQKYPNGLKKLLFEIKSVNSQVFWSKKDYLTEAYPHHVLQTFTGMKATDLDEGRLFYISKDDLTTEEFGLFLNSKSINEAWEDDVREMTHYIRNGIEPPKPPDIVFDERKKLRFQYKKKKYCIKGCYTPNWEIKWSNYITKITGIKGKKQEDVVEKWESKIKGKIKDKNEELKAKFKEKL